MGNQLRGSADRRSLAATPADLFAVEVDIE
jgi:hypothetical protein